LPLIFAFAIDAILHTISLFSLLMPAALIIIDYYVFAIITPFYYFIISLFSLRYAITLFFAIDY